MIVDLTINKKGGHFTYYYTWCKKIDKEIIDTKKQAFLKLFQIINSEKLVLPSEYCRQIFSFILHDNYYKNFVK